MAMIWRCGACRILLEAPLGELAKALRAHADACRGRPSIARAPVHLRELIVEELKIAKGGSRERR
jgi:hypothetical protein